MNSLRCFCDDATTGPVYIPAVYTPLDDLTQTIIFFFTPDEHAIRDCIE